MAKAPGESPPGGSSRSLDQEAIRTIGTAYGVVTSLERRLASAKGLDNETRLSDAGIEKLDGLLQEARDTAQLIEKAKLPSEREKLMYSLDLYSQAFEAAYTGFLQETKDGESEKPVETPTANTPKPEEKEKPTPRKSSKKKEEGSGNIDSFSDPRLAAFGEELKKNGKVSAPKEAAGKAGETLPEALERARRTGRFLRGQKQNFDAQLAKSGRDDIDGSALDDVIGEVDRIIGKLEDDAIPEETRFMHANRLNGQRSKFLRIQNQLLKRMKAPKPESEPTPKESEKAEAEDPKPETEPAVDTQPQEGTPAEQKKALAENVHELFARNAGVLDERNAMETAKEHYFAAYKEFHANKKFWQLKEPKELKDLEAIYTKSRVDYAHALDTSMKKRLTAKRGEKYEKYGKVVEAYNERIRFNEVIKPAIEAKLQARTEVLDANGRGAFTKAGRWLAKKNQALETWAGSKTKARLIRAAGAALVVSGAAGVVTGAAFSALFGYGAIRFARSFGGAYLTSAVTGVYQQFVVNPSKERSEAFLASKDSRYGKDGPLTETSLARMDAERKKNLDNLDKRTQAQRNAWRNLFIAAGVGAVTAETLSELFSADSDIDIVDAEQTPASESASSEAPLAPQSSATASPESATPPEEAAQDTSADGALEQTVDSVPEGTPGLIDEPGEGTDRAFRELQGHLKDTTGPSPALKHFLESDPNIISREMGEVYGTRGMVTHPGDRFYFDEQQNLMFKPVNGDPQPFITNDPNAESGYVIHELDAKPLSPIAEARSGAGTAASATPEASVSEGPVDQASEAAAAAEAAEAATAAAAGTPTTTSSRPLTIEDTLQSGVPADRVGPLEDYASDRNGPLTIEDTLRGPAPEAGMPEPSGASQGTGPLQDYRNGPLTIEDTLRNESAAPTSWVPGDPLPAEPAVFNFQDQSNMVYANGTTPENSLALAQEYAARNPGTTVLFNNTEYDWLGGRTERVGSVTFDGNGAMRELVQEVRDQNGNPLRGIDTNRLSRRIV